MPTNFVLDTNVLLHDPAAIFAFAPDTVVIPIYVIEEIDTFKKHLNELGRNARTVSRHLDQLRETGPLSEGVELDNGGHLRVALTSRVLPQEFSNTGIQDNAILAVALDVKESCPEGRTVFVSKDVNLRIRADALGLSAENYEAGKVDISELDAGWSTLEVGAEQIDELYASGGFSLEAPPEQGYPNQFFLVQERDNPNHSGLARYQRGEQRAERLCRAPKEGVWGIRPRNKEQHYALELLLDPDVQLVTLVGKAGTGKTLVALAAGLLQVADERTYDRLIVSRPIFPLGRDLGYLPGSVEEKLNPWMQPIHDNFDLLLGISAAARKGGARRGYDDLVSQGLVAVEPLTYIRGRSIPHQYMVVDEAQNLTPHEMKTILTRAGEGTKIVCTGDPYQIDNPYVDASTNGLAYIVNRFRSETLAGHMTLTKGERSPLAELATNLL